MSCEKQNPTVLTASGASIRRNSDISLKWVFNCLQGQILFQSNKQKPPSEGK